MASYPSIFISCFFLIPSPSFSPIPSFFVQLIYKFCPCTVSDAPSEPLWNVHFVIKEFSLSRKLIFESLYLWNQNSKTRYFKLWIMKYQRFKPLGSKGIGIQKLGFVTKAQFFFEINCIICNHWKLRLIFLNIFSMKSNDWCILHILHILPMQNYYF